MYEHLDGPQKHCAKSDKKDHILFGIIYMEYPE
jgi:hypothetical protein